MFTLGALRASFTLLSLRASGASFTSRAYRPLGANVTGFTFCALRALGASHAHGGRIIQSAIVSPANDALA